MVPGQSIVFQDFAFFFFQFSFAVGNIEPWTEPHARQTLSLPLSYLSSPFVAFHAYDSDHHMLILHSQNLEDWGKDSSSLQLSVAHRPDM